MKIKLLCGEVDFEWYNWQEIEIDTDDFDFFVIHYRLDSWHLIGYKYDKQIKKWSSEELSKYQASFLSLADFIARVDKPISKIINFHNSLCFYQKLYKLLKQAKVIKELEAKDGE